MTFSSRTLELLYWQLGQGVVATSRQNGNTMLGVRCQEEEEEEEEDMCRMGR